MMVSVVLIGILASITIPKYLELHRRAMRAEPLPNLRAIGVAEQAYFATMESWRAAGPNPETPVGPVARAFERGRPDWTVLGWYPGGPVRCSYSATVLDHGDHVRADALCDLDGDRQVMLLRYEVPAGDRQGEFLDLYPERF